MKKLPWLQIKLLFSSLAQPCPTLCDQHARPPCSSPTPGACSNSCALSWWCHQTISFLVVPFSSYLQSFPASRSFQMSQLLASDGQSIGVSASVLPMYIQDWFPLALTGLIFLLSKGFSRVFFNTSSKASALWQSDLFMVQLSFPYLTTGKAITLTIQPWVGKVVSLLFNMMSQLVIAFLPKEQVSFNLMAAVTIHSDFGAQESNVPHCLPIYLPWSDGTRYHDLSFLNVEFSVSFFTLLFHFHEEALSFLFISCRKGGFTCVSEVIDILETQINTEPGQANVIAQ